MIINVSIGAFQEWRAENSAASLRQLLHIRPTVLRGGVRRRIDIEQIAPGDIVFLESGSAVPADARLISTEKLIIDESLLTGESKPVVKNHDSVFPEATPVGDRRNMAFAGSMVVSGRATGLVCATGGGTELGIIASMLTGRGGRPPLLIRMERFSNRIGVGVVALAMALGVGQYMSGVALTEVFLLTVALAVSAIPEGLPVAITVALAIASHRMSRRNVIVRRLPAVEALGSCTLIATDKTGTLTVNRLTATTVVLADGATCEIEGEGLALTGEVRRADGGSPGRADRRNLEALARAAILTNEAALNVTGGAVEASGDPVDVALLVLLRKLGVEKTSENGRFRQIAALPYEPQQGYSASLDADPQSRLLSVKGAPEVVLAMCSDDDRATADTAVHTLARDGYRVIAVAQGAPGPGDDPLTTEQLRGLRLLGFVGLIDPLRDEAPGAVAEARSAGVDVRMITGDHPETAAAIARKLDPSRTPEAVLTGADIGALDAQTRGEKIGEASVYARVEPAQKNLIVRELQKQGHFVAVTGDGVNDAPALKAAHVGVAMGASGTDVARAAADLILTDDNFASIVAGIKEGRAAYDNIRKIVWLLLATAVCEVLIFTFALALGLPIPLTAVQILWMNLVTEGVQDVALAYEGKEPGLMQRPPRRPREPVFDRQMIEQCLVVGLYISFIAFGLFYVLVELRGLDAPEARNLVLLFLVLFHNFHAFNCRSETRSAFAIPLRANPILLYGVLGAQGVHILAMHLPVISNVLETQPVALSEWLTIALLASTIIAVAELYKLLVARPRQRKLVRALRCGAAPDSASSAEEGAGSGNR